MKKEKSRYGLRWKTAAFMMAAAVFFAGILAGCGSSSVNSSASADTAAATDTGATKDYGWDRATENAVTEETDEVYTLEDAADSQSGAGAAIDDAADYDMGDYDSADSDAAVAEESESDTEEDSYSQKLIKTVDMTVETTEFDELIAQLESKTEELGGYIESSETSGSSNRTASRWSSLTIRIPAADLDEFVSLVGESANVTYTSESTEDVTLTYVDMESHLTALRTEQESLLAMLAQADSVESIIAIQSQLTEVRYEIESYESQLRVYDNRVSYSTVYLSIDEVERETSAATVTFGESVRTRFSDNVYRVRQGLRNFAIGFLGALPFIIVVVVIVAAFLIICRLALRHRCRKKEKMNANAADRMTEEMPHRRCRKRKKNADAADRAAGKLPRRRRKKTKPETERPESNGAGNEERKDLP